MSEWDDQSGGWLCSRKDGMIEEIYQNDDMCFNFHDVEDHNNYNNLCSFDYQLIIAFEVYTLRILFPNCQFSSQNQLITVQLIKGDDLIDNNNYQISFSKNIDGITGANINYDQNMKVDFFVNLISNNWMNLEVLDVNAAIIPLNGLKEAMSKPFCI